MRPVEIRVHQEVLFLNSYSEFQKQHEQTFSQEFLLTKSNESFRGFWVNNDLMTWWNSVRTQLLWEPSNSFCTWNLASTVAGTFCWYTSHCGKREKRKIKQLFWEVTSKTKTFWFSIPRHNKEAIYIISAGWRRPKKHCLCCANQKLLQDTSVETLSLWWRFLTSPEYQVKNVAQNSVFSQIIADYIFILASILLNSG